MCKGALVRAVAQHRAEQSTQVMIRATAELIEGGGLRAVTVAAVARRAGTSNGSLYHRFGDREGLLVALQRDTLDRLEAEALAVMELAREQEPEAAMRSAVRGALRLFGQYRSALRAFFVEGQEVAAFEARNAECLRRLSESAEALLVDRLGVAATEAAAIYRVLFSVGATRALFTEEQMRSERVGDDELENVLVRLLRR
ncbi:TetR family transcriptional regulator [Aeromicrobium piscarium]|uniref:TetR family transcriptional regulator n=1 Tax=Aeromicrobium piscarium TaxID=2590901 RepID=A0A554SPF5_9ACTN|nr:TetR family transcriptional regulator [Aeromicrobium piscarium]